MVYGLSWTEIINGTYVDNQVVSFDAELVNHNGSKVASFLTWFEDKLYVGSYMDGCEGELHIYDMSDTTQPNCIGTITIPERIQGITFEQSDEYTEMILSQGYQTEDSKLLWFSYDEEQMILGEQIREAVMSEGIEQILSTADGLYVLFEAGVRPYRETARVVNDQIYLFR